VFPGTFQRPGSGQCSIACGGLIGELPVVGKMNKRKPMNNTRTSVHHLKPPRLARVLISSLVTIVLRSPWHGIRSYRLLLITFTGRKSGKEFTVPIRYVQEGETLQMIVVYPWWKNLVEQPTVRVLLRGQMRLGVAEVVFEEAGTAVVKIHLKATN
jgi:hypothetical protein